MCVLTNLTTQVCSSVPERGDDHLALVRVLAALLQLLLRVTQALAERAQCVVATLQLSALGLQVALQGNCLSPQTQRLLVTFADLGSDAHMHEDGVTRRHTYNLEWVKHLLNILNMYTNNTDPHNGTYTLGKQF